MKRRLDAVSLIDSPRWKMSVQTRFVANDLPYDKDRRIYRQCGRGSLRSSNKWIKYSSLGPNDDCQRDHADLPEYLYFRSSSTG